MSPTIALEMTRTEHERLKELGHALILSYVNEAGETTRAWVAFVGTLEDCEEEAVHTSAKMYIVPNGFTIESKVLSKDDLPVKAEENDDGNS